MRHVRDAIQGNLEWNRNLLFDLFRGDSRPLGDHLDVIIRDVWIGLNWKRVKGDDARREKQQCKCHDKQAMSQGEIDNSTNHLLLLLDRVLEDQRVGNHLIAWLDA